MQGRIKINRNNRKWLSKVQTDKDFFIFDEQRPQEYIYTIPMGEKSYAVRSDRYRIHAVELSDGVPWCTALPDPSFDDQLVTVGGTEKSNEFFHNLNNNFLAVMNGILDDCENKYNPIVRKGEKEAGDIIMFAEGLKGSLKNDATCSWNVYSDSATWQGIDAFDMQHMSSYAGILHLDLWMFADALSVGKMENLFWLKSVKSPVVITNKEKDKIAILAPKHISLEMEL